MALLLPEAVEVIVTRRRSRGCWRWMVLTALLFVAAVGALQVVRRTSQGRALFNIAEYRLRMQWNEWFGEQEPPSGPTGAISGVVLTEDGQPVAEAIVLVSGVKGDAHYGCSDGQGQFRIGDVPPGRYVAVASKWGYDDRVYRRGLGQRTSITVLSSQASERVDFQLAEHVRRSPILDEPPQLGPTETGVALFPAEVYAHRVPVTYTNHGLVITTTLVYEPVEVDSGLPLPVLVACYPSAPLNWDRVSVAIANEGYVVLATGPSPQRGFDIPGLALDLLKAVAYLRDGQLSTHADGQREGWLSGSFSSVVLFRALWEEPGRVDALVMVGGISDSFLGVQALYDEHLEIPPQYATLIAAQGRPDRYPEVYLGYSPAFYAEHMPPTFVVHTRTDEVIPASQAERFGAALETAGVTHELFIYEDTTHYLDQVNVTPDTAELYRRLVAFLDHYVREAT